jgi:hypothetical protein
MTDMAAISAAFQAVNGIKTIAEGLLATRDISLIGGKVAELNFKIIDAQNGIMAANQERSALIERISALEKEIADLKEWDAEKKRYQLEKLDTIGVTAYVLKKDAANGEPPHVLCPNCYSQGQKSIFQATPRSALARRVHLCPRCKLELAFNSSWMGSSSSGF